MVKNLFAVFVLFINLCVAFFIRAEFLFSKKVWPDEALYAWYEQRILQNPQHHRSPTGEKKPIIWIFQRP